MWGSPGVGGPLFFFVLGGCGSGRLAAANDGSPGRVVGSLVGFFDSGAGWVLWGVVLRDVGCGRLGGRAVWRKVGALLCAEGFVRVLSTGTSDAEGADGRMLPELGVLELSERVVGPGRALLSGRVMGFGRRGGCVSVVVGRPATIQLDIMCIIGVLGRPVGKGFLCLCGLRGREGTRRGPAVRRRGGSCGGLVCGAERGGSSTGRRARAGVEGCCRVIVDSGRCVCLVVERDACEFELGARVGVRAGRWSVACGRRRCPVCGSRKGRRRLAS